MARVITLKLRGRPEPWSTYGGPETVEIWEENSKGWFGRLASKRAGPVVFYPRYAWEETGRSMKG